MEETGFEIQVDALDSVHSRANVGILFIVYRAHLVGGRAQLSDEVAELQFCAPRNVPPQPPTHADTPLDKFFLETLASLDYSSSQRKS
ncbi:NUDIX hydrolase [Anaerolineae bacterium CFX7]|nr:NUDIX hydrolase [Anaerolineae bacterium CFX7]